MYLSNGTILIQPENDTEQLDAAVELVHEHLYREHGITAKLMISDAYPFPAYVLPLGVKFSHLDEALRPHLALRAINQDILELPDRETVDVQHFFNTEEKENLAKGMTENFLEKNRLESELNRIKKNYAARIADCEAIIKENAKKYNEGHEYREVRSIVKLNFNDGAKYYYDEQKPTVLLEQREMKATDYQLRIDHHEISEAHYNPADPLGDGGMRIAPEDQTTDITETENEQPVADSFDDIGAEEKTEENSGGDTDQAPEKKKRGYNKKPKPESEPAETAGEDLPEPNTAGEGYNHAQEPNGEDLI